MRDALAGLILSPAIHCILDVGNALTCFKYRNLACTWMCMNTKPTGSTESHTFRGSWVLTFCHLQNWCCFGCYADKLMLDAGGFCQQALCTDGFYSSNPTEGGMRIHRYQVLFMPSKNNNNNNTKIEKHKDALSLVSSCYFESPVSFHFITRLGIC